MRMLAVLGLLVMVTSGSPAAAMTNRELLTQQPGLGASFVSGVASFVMDLQVEGVSDEEFAAFNQCMINANLSPLMLYNRVLEWIATHPQDIEQPVTTAVLNTIDQICFVPIRPAHPNQPAPVAAPELPADAGV